jgi:uncharacterized protein
MSNTYIDIFNDIKDFLEQNDENATKLGKKFPFRKRSDHIWRVFIWAKRLLCGFEMESINKNAILVAALFHDAGYGILTGSKSHAENSVDIFDKYSEKVDMGKDEKEFIKYLIGNHSKKELLGNDDTPIELIILMEADILDETGALSIVWDCMAEGSQEEQSFLKTYKHIREKSFKILEKNPMVTQKAKEIWKRKQELVKEFCEQLINDLGPE